MNEIEIFIEGGGEVISSGIVRPTAIEQWPGAISNGFTGVISPHWDLDGEMTGP
jgi:hypothetical protein